MDYVEYICAGMEAENVLHIYSRQTDCILTQTCLSQLSCDACLGRQGMNMKGGGDSGSGPMAGFGTISGLQHL
jgi:hypothetical protein